MDWSDVLKLALSIFLILTGVGLAYLFLRMAGVFARLGTSLTRVTDEVVPILSRAQTTVDGINLELARVDEMMKTAVGATKGAEKTVQAVSNAVTKPVRKISGLAAGAREAVATLRARRAAEAAAAAERAQAPAAEPPVGPVVPDGLIIPEEPATPAAPSVDGASAPPAAAEAPAAPPPPDEPQPAPRHESPY
ncbi:MAG: hypothetical protein AB7V42_04370 [Thermoleophilia bacterium]